MSLPSESPLLQWVSYAFGGMVTSFGINAIARPAHALALFEFEPPNNLDDRRTADSLMVIYGSRSLFMGAALFSASRNGHKSTLGWLLVSIGGVALADGLLCKSQGKTAWTHFGFVPIAAGTGALLLGLLD
ncbi:hypothetical protein PspLS_09749 [Pyricularia sp. CBS 133598]|nr:hypothetical protein PspLS_09749 [Pyricularia sp. CBS 133598]